jgi:RecA protein
MVMSQIDRNFGKGTIMRLGDASRMKVETIPTGALTLDLALGGGLPKGRVIEIYGPESSGKTTLALHAIAEVQKSGGTAAFVDAEHALDPTYSANLGVDIDNLLVSQPDTGEAALEIVDQLVRSTAIDLVVVDSVAALVPRAEIEGEMGDTHVGLQARLMSQALRKITGNIGKTGCSVIFLNQLRQKIGVSYGNPETTTGGNALKFYASVRLDIRRIQTLKKGTEEYGIRAKVKVAKNKVAPPFRVAEFDVIFGQGISTYGCLMDLAEETGVVTRKGAWYSYNGENISQGRDNAIKYMEENPDFAKEVDQLVRQKLEMGAVVSANSVAPVDADDEDYDELEDEE